MWAPAIAAISILLLPVEAMRGQSPYFGSGPLLAWSQLSEDSGCGAREVVAVTLDGLGSAGDGNSARGEGEDPAKPVAQVVYRGDFTEFRVVDRLDASHLLVRLDGGAIQVLNMDERELVPMGSGAGARQEVIGFANGGVLFLQATEPGGGVQQLCRFGTGLGVEVLADAVDVVLEVRGEGVWFVRDRAIWIVMHKPGTERKVCELPEDGAIEELRFLTWEVSPNGRFAAVSIPEPGRSGGAHRVQVFDTVTGEIVGTHGDIPVQLVGRLAATPSLRMVFLDDQTLRFSESIGSKLRNQFQWVDWDISRDVRVREEGYGPRRQEHAQPSGPRVARVGDPPSRFVWTMTKLMLVSGEGAAEQRRTLLEVPGGGSDRLWVEVSDGLRWARAFNTANRLCTVFDAGGDVVLAMTLSEGEDLLGTSSFVPGVR